MLGFLADYLKVKVTVKLKDGKRKEHFYFIKAISKTNEAKCQLVKEWKLFDKEIFFYVDIKNKFENKAIKPWSPELIAVITDAMVFQDMNAMDYVSRDKFLRFDFEHTIQCLKALARFHASSIIYEEKRTNELGRPYSLEEDYGDLFDNAGYKNDDAWFKECKLGALQAIKEFSKYRHDKLAMNDIDNKWDQVWSSAINLSELKNQYRNVLCHRDLWNNNILFHYEKECHDSIPNDCVFIDFQAIKCQPPSSDVMLVLYCNLESNLREKYFHIFLDIYYKELSAILSFSEINIKDIISMAELTESAEFYRKWSIVLCACLLPQFWINDHLITKIFSDTNQYQHIMCKDKGNFIKEMMNENDDYKEKVMEIFDEIIERYCVTDNK